MGMGDDRYQLYRDHKSGADCQGADADSPVAFTWCPSGCFSVFCVGEKSSASVWMVYKGCGFNIAALVEVGGGC